MSKDAFEIWEDPKGVARFHFAHTGKDFTTGVLTLKPDAELPRHNRPNAEENLLQISGVCQITLYSEDGDLQASYKLYPGMHLKMKKGQWHVHANPFEEESVTQFKAEGDIREVVAKMRDTFTPVEPPEAPEHQP
jgi:quercetin dioxygenase-like cupin family protein